MQHRKAYESDVSDEQWEILEGFIPRPKPGGSPPKYDRREILNGILYVLRTGCGWRHLPHDLPPWESVYGYFRRWTKEGLWEWLADSLREVACLEAGKKSPRARRSSTVKA